MPFKPEHLRALRLQPAQAWCEPHLTDDLLAQTAELEAYTAMVDGEPIACAGFMPFWEGRAMVWSYIGAQAGSHMFAITRAVQRALDLTPYRRVEAYVDAGFEAGVRWVTLLEFEFEGTLRAFLPDGRDQLLFARVKNG